MMIGAFYYYRFAPAAVLAAVSLGVTTLLAVPAVGQFGEVPATTSSTLTPASSDSQTGREAEYASLAQDVERFGRELGLVKRVVKLVTPAVVHIEATPRNQGLLKVEEAGSGVLVQLGSSIFVLTNRHVIRHSESEKNEPAALRRITIHLADGRSLHPTRVVSDSETDVAVLSISATNLPSARLGNSDALEIGDFVLAIGSPFGLSQSVTRGIVSAKGRHNLNLGDDELKWQNFIQTDAAINPGNSGGPLVNLRGEIVGLNTAIASASGGNEGIGFSIPANIVARTALALVEGREPPRGFLGVDLDDTFNERRAMDLGLHHLVGSRVIGMTPNSPADRAELRYNDVIVKYNDVTIENDSHLRTLVKLEEIGKQVELLIYRDGKPLRKTIEIGNLRDFPKDPQQPDRPSGGSR